MNVKTFRRMIGLTCALMLCVGMAQAELPSSVMTRIDAMALSDGDRGYFISTIETIGKDYSEAELLALVDELSADYQADSLLGVLQGDLYTHPVGIQLVVPGDWSLNEAVGDALVVCFADADDRGFMPILRVFLPQLEAELPNEMTVEDFEALFPPLAETRELQTFESIAYKGVTAWEQVYTYTDPEQGSLMAYQFFFVKDDMPTLITFLIRNDAEMEAYLTVYDAFLASFETGV